MKKQQDLHKQKRVRMPSMKRLDDTDAICNVKGMIFTVCVSITPKYAPFLCAGSRA